MGAVLMSAYGSGGSLFPLVPVALRLQENGHDVRWAVPRVLSLYLRPLGMPTFSLGTGADLGVREDPQTVTTRFDGWLSLQRYMTGYVGASLAADVATVERVIGEWRPDIVVSSSFAASARIAGFRQGIPQAVLSAHPTVLARVPRAPGFALRYRSLCATVAGLTPEHVHSNLVTELAWGVGQDTVLMHDPALLSDPAVLSDPALSGDHSTTRVGVLTRDGEPTEVVGFPYWDDALRRQADVDAVHDWLDGAGAPAVAVTMGSFLGARRRELWDDIARAVTALGVRVLFLGPRRELNDLAEAVETDCLAAGFVPLSQIAGKVNAILHHGGVGTTFAALLAGTPAVVLPLAFDQPFNARLVEGVGAGLRVTDRSMRQALERVLRDDDLTLQARAVAQRLTPSESAISRLVELVEARI